MILNNCKVRYSAGFCLLFVLSLPHEASAYIDPGVGSSAFQLMIASIVTLLFTAKVWMRKMGDVWCRIFRGKKVPSKTEK